jgi:hypothetical protein
MFIQTLELTLIDSVENRFLYLSKQYKPEIADTLGQIYNIRRAEFHGNSAEKLLEMIEPLIKSRMEELRSLPSCKKPTAPEVSDTLDIFSEIEISSFDRDLKAIKKLTQNKPGETTWRWVEIDNNDKRYSTITPLEKEPWYNPSDVTPGKNVPSLVSSAIPYPAPMKTRKPANHLAIAQGPIPFTLGDGKGKKRKREDEDD